MPTNVPYIFAGYTGNIPLSYLDANFANVKANVDNAGTANSALVATTAITASSATVATRAATVTTAAQPNITSVGILNSLSVVGNIGAGNINIIGSTQTNFILANIANIAGNLALGNLATSGLVNVVGNIDGGNMSTAGQISAAGNITTAGTLVAGNIVGTISGIANQSNYVNTVVGGSTNTDYSVPYLISTSGFQVPQTDPNFLFNPSLNRVTANYFYATSNFSGNVSGDLTGNVSAPGNVSATGNITGGNIISSSVVNATGNAAILTGTAVPAGGTTGAGYKFSSTANFGIFFGSGAPTLSAAQGSLYLRTDGIANARVYVNNNGSTGWTGLESA